MKRLIFAVLIAVFLIASIMYGSDYVDATTRDILGHFSKVEQAVEKEDFESAGKIITQAENKWIVYEEKLTLFVNHNEICTIGEGIAAMKPYIENKEKAEFYSELNKTRVVLIHLANMEKVGKE